ncbi:MAG: RNA-binding protein [Promethearchaeota archaeon]|nr:MAG: RNA-binding protein [Candidatus Lokiarchaeota archaeon]
MSKKSAKQNDIVVIGQYLGVIEEFLPHKNSTYTREGEIYATKSGEVKIDHNKRKIKVKTHQEKDRKAARPGDIVLGQVRFLRKYSIGFNFYTINGKLHFNSSNFGNVHVSQISNSYVEKIKDAFQVTDIIRAKVLEQNLNEFKLTTKGKHLGVVHADCSICGTKLERIGFDKLKCPRCGHIEKRKLAQDYGDVSQHLRL